MRVFFSILFYLHSRRSFAINEAYLLLFPSLFLYNFGINYSLGLEVLRQIGQRRVRVRGQGSGYNLVFYVILSRRTAADRKYRWHDMVEARVIPRPSPVARVFVGITNVVKVPTIPLTIATEMGKKTPEYEAIGLGVGLVGFVGLS